MTTNKRIQSHQVCSIKFAQYEMTRIPHPQPIPHKKGEEEDGRKRQKENKRDHNNKQYWIAVTVCKYFCKTKTECASTHSHTHTHTHIHTHTHTHTHTQSGEISQTGRQQIPVRWRDVVRRTLTKRFQITFRNLQKL